MRCGVGWWLSMTNSGSQSIFGNSPVLTSMKKLNRPTKLSQLLHAAAVLLVCAGFGSPSLRAATGEFRQSLNGPWQFTTNAAAITSATATWDVITVPGNWDTLPAYSTHIGKGWYQRTFTVPPDWKGKHIRLKFDAVYEMTEVWLNGKSLGAHGAATLRGRSRLGFGRAGRSGHGGGD